MGLCLLIFTGSAASLAVSWLATVAWPVIAIIATVVLGLLSRHARGNQRLAAIVLLALGDLAVLTWLLIGGPMTVATLLLYGAVGLWVASGATSLREDAPPER
ncbi:hypothetical protein [Microbacterium maritypicum]